jgi:hypothetical protein
LDVQFGLALSSQNIDPIKHLLITAEKEFWRDVETGEPPRLFGIQPRNRE